MTPERWRQAKAIFEGALEMAPADRPEFVSEACHDDEDLRVEVFSLLDAHEQADGFTMATAKLPAVSMETGALPGEVSHTRNLKICLHCRSHFDTSIDICPNDGEVLESDPEGLIGSVVDGSYRIEKLLGRGGMGAVYLAEHILLRDRVALKLLPDDVRDSAGRMRRFLREGRLSRAIRHPNVVAVHELRVPASGPAYMVLEYVDGRTLREEIRASGRLSLDQTVAILTPVADALDHAHANGLLHRDLKPDNIMVPAPVNGVSSVKVLDLGIAKLLDEGRPDRESGTALTLEGQILGTPAYMSPEQWGEIPADGGTDLDVRADVYSLAVVAFEMLSGNLPFTADSLAGLRRAHVSIQPAKLTDLVESCPEAASATIARALSKDRANRPSSVGEFVAELRTASVAIENREQESGHENAVQPAQQSESAIPEVPAGPAPRRAWPMKILSIGAAVLAVVGIGAWYAIPGSGDLTEGARAGAAWPLNDTRENRVRYSLVMQRAGDPPEAETPLPAPENAVFRTGDGIRLTVESQRDGFLYVVNEGPLLDAATGLPRYTVIFPGPFANGGSARLSANRSVRILERGWIQFDDTDGTDTLWIIWSARSLDDFEDLGKFVNARQKGRITDPVRVEAIQAALTRYAAEAPKRTTRTEINQTTLAGQSEVLVHPLRFEH